MAPALPDAPALLAIFVLTFLGIAAGRVPGLKLDRTGIALLGAIAVMVFGGMPTETVVAFVHWPTILLLFAFFVISAQLRLSGFFDAVALAVARRMQRPWRFLALLMLATAGLSAFLNHDIVVIVFTPVVAAALLRERLNPVPFLIAIAIASNIGAAATPIGNPQGMMIAQVAGLSFGPYVAWCLPPVLFALGCAFAVIRWLSRDELAAPVTAAPPVMPEQWPPDRAHMGKGLVILAIVMALFFAPLPKELVALTAAAIHLASPKFRTRDLLRLVDWQVLVLFIGLFVVTGAFAATGYGARAVGALARAGLHLDAPATLALITTLLANLVNNAAAVMLLLDVPGVSQPPNAYVLALANSFGGSLLIVGSVSNIIVVQQARAQGVRISFRAYARLGAPVTLAALLGLLGWSALMA